ncbi:MAG TPA: hypothetical protein VFJ94_13960 [Intrasporangium sp.]|uniref:hypothetical protein n=1 Tax=Intrasporangium sp. TaxID=1925024 RepID=UPI002D79123A|nr:hypothetical protein [Intrasporangium sp.]HET7399618.1 hypothetical protein [Intrasporangium sp.]
MHRRPRIKPWLPPMRRRHGEVQFGVAPGGVILSGVTSAEARLLARLDGSLSREASFVEATKAGVTVARWRELLALLAELDLLEPLGRGHPAAAESSGHVLVEGAEPLSFDIATLLRRCGVARVSHGRPAVDVVLADPSGQRPAVAVLVGTGALDPRRGDVWLRHGIPALPVVPVGPRVSVGPVVGAGPTTPCLWCLDLHRTDRDTEWPTVLAQLCPGDQPLVPVAPEVALVQPALASVVAGTVALLALRLVVGDPAPEGVSVEVGAPWPRMDHRRWARHPRCQRHESCGAAASRPA